MLDLISSTEGTSTNGYLTGFGGKLLPSLDDHPRTTTPFTQTDGTKSATSAAGRYQFLTRTWDGLAKQYGFSDFSPRNQDLGAVALLSQAGALPDVLNGNFTSAINKSGKIWASLPSSNYQQPKKGWDSVSKQLGSSYDPLEEILSSGKPQAKPTNAKVGQPAPSTNKSNDYDPLEEILSGNTSSVTPPSFNMSRAQIAQKLGYDINDPRVDEMVKATELRKQGKSTAGVFSPQSDMKGSIGEGAIIGATGLGSGIIQSAYKVGDLIAKGINSVAGTHLKDNEYDDFTKSRQQVINDYDAARYRNGRSGFDAARMGGEIVGTAPIAALSRGYQGARIISQAGGRVAAQNAAVGAAMGGTQFAGNADERLNNTAAGALGGALGGIVADKVIVPIATKSASYVANKVLGSTDNTIAAATNHLTNALDSQGVKLSELPENVQSVLVNDTVQALKSGNDIIPEAAARKAALLESNIQGTTGQIQSTVNPAAYSIEQNAAHQPGGAALADKFTNDSRAITGNLEKLKTDIGGNAATPSSAGDTAQATLRNVHERNYLDPLNNAQAAVDSFAARGTMGPNDVSQTIGQTLDDHLAQRQAQIAQSYSEAHALPGAKYPIDSTVLVNNIKSDLGHTYNDLPSKIKTSIENYSSGMNIGDANNLIARLNAEFSDSANGNVKNALDRVRGHVDKAIEDAATKPIGGLQPRLPPPEVAQAKYAFESARASAKKLFDEFDQIPALKDMSNGEPADTIFEKHILNGKIPQIKATINKLNTIDPSLVQQIQGTAMRHIQNSASSASQLESALGNIGDARMEAIFGRDGAELAHKMLQSTKSWEQSIKGLATNDATKVAMNDIDGRVFFQKHILNGDPKRLIETIKTLKAENPQALNDVRRQVVDYFLDVGTSHNGAITISRLLNKVDDIGQERLNLIFEPAQLKELNKIIKVAKILKLEPEGATVNRSHTSNLMSAQVVVGSLKALLSMIPKAGPVLAKITENGALKYKNMRLGQNALKGSITSEVKLGSPAYLRLSGAQKEALQRFGEVVDKSGNIIRLALSQGAIDSQQ
ncbi:hypothetical protein HYN46_16975 [Aquirhabdus parva]|uniref:Lysozyme n=2 Tax=Aquirhabdus parva TaxID=2283318 RepID=A0A345P2C4_9GAMM|nr:hypothetical protein HYN46_00060 [Aquirhabdus parva]AXI04379.1 hypothetical protein HYN46_16975 [Aquirhabdus parva]